jgi:hypothetical protein
MMAALLPRPWVRPLEKKAMSKKIFYIIIASLFILFLIEDWMLYRPSAKKLEELNQAIAQSQSQALGHLIPTKQLEEIQELVAQNTIRITSDTGAEGQASEHLGRLTSNLKELNIELLSITPREVKQQQGYITSSYLMELRCDYHQFRQLLEIIEKSYDLIHITSFQLVTIQAEVVVTLGVKIYLFTEEWADEPQVEL